MSNPLRSEADAFRWLVWVVAGAAVVIAVALLTRPLFGALLALVLVLVVLRLAWRALTEWRAEGAVLRARQAEEEKRALARLYRGEKEVD